MPHSVVKSIRVSFGPALMFLRWKTYAFVYRGFLLILLIPGPASAQWTATVCCTNQSCGGDPCYPFSYPAQIQQAECDQAVAVAHAGCNACGGSFSGGPCVWIGGDLSSPGSPFQNLSGNGITSGTGGLSNNFGITRLTGPEQGQASFTSHATTANKQWMEEAMRRQTAIAPLRDTPAPKTTLDYERNYLKKTNPKAPCAGVSGPCIGSLDAKPDLSVLKNKETPVKNSISRKPPKDDNQGIKKRKEMDAFEIERWSYERSNAAIRFQEAQEEFDRKRAVEKSDSLADKALNYVGGEYYRVGRAAAEKFIQDKLPGVGALIGRIKTAEKGTAIAAAFTGVALQDAKDAAMAGARGDSQKVDDISAKKHQDAKKLEGDVNQHAAGQAGGSGAAAYSNAIKSEVWKAADKGAVQAVWGSAASAYSAVVKTLDDYMTGKK